MITRYYRSVSILFVVYFPVLVYLQCTDEFTVARFGVEYLRLNGTNDLWSCNNTNLCSRINAVESTNSQQQLQLQTITATRPSFSATIANSTAAMNSDTVLYNVKFDTVDYDTTNSYNATSGLYQVPASGKYLVHAYLLGIVLNGAKADYAQVVLNKNGGAVKRLFRQNLMDSIFKDQIFGGSCVISANQNDTLSISLAMATTVVTTSSWRVEADWGNSFMINKID